MISTMKGVCIVLLVLSLASSGHAHGRMIEPPSRASMWRFGFSTPINRDDHALDCGGLGVQWSVNGGRCGICGDPYNASHPENEAGGKYATGTIARRYLSGQTITVQVEIAVDHGGWSEFRICPNNNVKEEAKQECLDRNVLAAANGQTRFYHPRGTGILKFYLVLPPALTCSQCVMQWKWDTDSSNNCNSQHPEMCCVGCGHQEQFFNCADVAIAPSAIKFPTLPSGFLPIIDQNPVPALNTSTNGHAPNESGGSNTPIGYLPIDVVVQSKRVACMATSIGRYIYGTLSADNWCKDKCETKYCPMLLCSDTCRA